MGEKLYGLDLFSGIGGISEGLREWVTPIAYCDNEPYAQTVLLSRMADGDIDSAPIWDDVCTLEANQLPRVDIVYGGFPCQDISVAGLGKGLGGERSGLFYEVCRLVKEIKPRFVFLENVPAIRTRGLREVIRSLTDLGYDCRWTCVSAAEVGAPHLRKRWFLLAHSNNLCGIKKNRMQEQQRYVESLHKKNEVENSWVAEPNVGRVADGIPFRVDRVKALGNAVVPKQVKEAFEKLINLNSVRGR
jgi:DNA (cytosine-5)-methyltransferase 1